MAHRFFHGGSILQGNNTIPGVQLPKELKELAPVVFQKCRDYGLDFYPTVIQMLDYAEMSEVCAYGGFPVRYPHWSFGGEYEELQRGYEYSQHKIYETVVNTSPCYQYLLNSNTLVDNITVIAHATGHNHFFKNNIFFAPTSGNMMNQLANHGTRIRRYIARWGKERVTEFIDHVIRVQTLIDPAKAWLQREIKEPVIKDKRKYRQPRRLKVANDRLYMDPFINPKSFRDQENERIQRKEAGDELGVFEQPTKDILGYIRDNAPLKPWQQDIVSMLYEEAMFFSPQRVTHTENEGFACTLRNTLLSTDLGLLTIGDIVDHKLKVKVFDGKNFRQVTNWFKFENRKIYKITTKRGYELSGSSNHRVLNSKNEWVCLDALGKGDFIKIKPTGNVWTKRIVALHWQPLVRPAVMDFCKLKGIVYDQFKRFRRGENIIKNKQSVEAASKEYDDILAKHNDSYTQHVRRKNIVVPKYMDKKFATFLGLLTGDGHVSEAGRVIGFTNNEEYLADLFSCLVKELFGLECYKKWDDSSLNGRWRIGTHSKMLEEFLKYLGIPTGVCARVKKIPDMILRSPKSVMSAFLRAYFDCDGCAHKYGVILSTSSPEMVKQVQVVLLNYGILSSIYEKDKDNYHLSIGGESVKLFYQQIGFNSLIKQKKLCAAVYDRPGFRKQKWVDEVLSVEELVEDDVYDITVEDTHRYAAQGFINHNSFIDYEMMSRQGLVSLGQKQHDTGIIEYASHKMGVLGGKYSMNPYKLGFYLFLNIEDRWNKGKFGQEWDDCKDIRQREKWDTKAGLGKEKVFEVVKFYDDVMFISEFFTQEFCDEFEFFEWKHYPNGETKIESRDANAIRKKLVRSRLNGGLPDIRLTDPNHRGKGHFFLQHEWDGRGVYDPYVREVLTSLRFLWKNDVFLATRNKEGQELVYRCTGSRDADKEVDLISRKQYQKTGAE